MSEASGTGADNNVAGGQSQEGAGNTAGQQTNPEQKTEGTQQGAEGAKPKEGAEGAKPKEGGDTDYSFEFPEGMPVNEEELSEFKVAAKELKLDADQAKKLVGLRVKFAQAQAEAHETMVQGWADSSKTDKEFGGDKFEENLGIAKKALDTFGSDELRKFLKDSRIGNHPELIRFMHRVGKQISDDKFVKPGATTGATKSTADVIYG